MVSKNHDHISIFASVALLQKTDFFQNLQTFAIFNLNSHPEDDIIAKI